MKHYDIIGNLCAFESGDLDEKETLDLFQELVNTGMAWTLQGSYGRTAKLLIDEGLISDGPKISDGVCND